MSRELRSAAVVGTGLVGTSVGLALTSAGVDVLLSDTSAAHLQAAAARGAGRAADGDEVWRADVDLAVVAVPPSAVPAVATRLLGGPARAVVDVAGVKAPVEAALAEVEGHGRFCGSHPMAGREMSGPAAADGDLFAGRAWAVVPAPYTQPPAVAAAHALVAACGARAVQATAAGHDRAVALVSHLPYAVATALAARLGLAPEEAVVLAGPGVRDTTRVAASDPDLWAALLLANGDAVAPLLDAVGADLAELAAGLRAADAAAVAGLLARGRAGRQRLHG